MMSLRHRVFSSSLANSFARKLSDPVDRGWGDTFVGPLDALRELDASRELDQPPPAKPGSKVPPASSGTA